MADCLDALRSRLDQEYKNQVLNAFGISPIYNNKEFIMTNCYPQTDVNISFTWDTDSTNSHSFKNKPFLKNFKPKNIWFTEGGVTTVEFEDGDKITVKPMPVDIENFQPEYGVALAIARKVYGGNRSEFLRDVESSWNSYEGKRKGKMKKLSKESTKNSADGFPF